MNLWIILSTKEVSNNARQFTSMRNIGKRSSGVLAAYSCGRCWEKRANLMKESTSRYDFWKCRLQMRLN